MNIKGKGKMKTFFLIPDKSRIKKRHSVGNNINSMNMNYSNALSPRNVTLENNISNNINNNNNNSTSIIIPTITSNNPRASSPPPSIDNNNNNNNNSNTPDNNINAHGLLTITPALLSQLNSSNTTTTTTTLSTSNIGNHSNRNNHSGNSSTRESISPTVTRRESFIELEDANSDISMEEAN